MIRRILGALCALALLTAPCASLAQAMQFNPGGGSSGSVWGTITGTLSSQSDLNTALNGKAGLTANNTFSGANIFAPFTFNHGDGSAFDLGSIKQVFFGFNATTSYRQAIGTRHSSSTKTGNTFDFWLFDGSTQLAGDEPNVRIMTLDASTGLTVLGNAAATNLSGTNTGDQFTSIAQNTVLGRTAAGSGVASALSTIPTAAMPALTGDVTTSAGAVATTHRRTNIVTLAKLASRWRPTASSGTAPGRLPFPRPSPPCQPLSCRP
jgi:hypothetical protein